MHAKVPSLARPVIQLAGPRESQPLWVESRKHLAQKIFSGSVLAHPVIVADTLYRLPSSSLPQVAFVGHSNAGKSSLINALVKREVAVASKVPGRTRHLFNFEIGGAISLVDLPGYGFAKGVDRKVVSDWDRLITGYFESADNLQRIVILLNGEGKGPILNHLDEDMLKKVLEVKMISSPQVMFVLTKVDTLNTWQLHDKVLATLTSMSDWQSKGLKLWPYLHTVSSLHTLGVSEIQTALCDAVTPLKDALES